MHKLVLGAVSLLLAAPAFARIVVYEYTGTVSAASGGEVMMGDYPVGTVHVGDTFRGVFSYDSSMPLDVDPDSGWAGGYNAIWPANGTAEAHLYLDQAPLTVFADAAQTLLVHKDSLTASFTIMPSVYPTIYDAGAMTFTFYDATGHALPTLATPDSLSLGAFTSATVDFGWNQFGNHTNATGVLTSLTDVSPVSQVPEPEAYLSWLAVLGLSGAAALRRRVRPGKGLKPA